MEDKNLDSIKILINKLEGHDGDDVVIPYMQIARLFPSNEPHPSGFDLNLIDHETLVTACSSHGWEATAAHELDGSNAPYDFPVRFRRILNDEQKTK